MRFGLFHRGLDLLTPGEKMRRAHERWLSRALRGPEGALARIPVRRVDEGGFSLLLSVPGGRERAEQWWMDAFAAMDHAA